MKNLVLVSIMCVLLSSCSRTNVDTNTTNFASNDVYADDMERFRQNVSVKEQGEDFVIYEYKDIRIDELAPLAIKYCEDKANGMSAYLREIVLYRNHLRRATFDCQNLAKKE